MKRWISALLCAAVACAMTAANAAEPEKKDVSLSVGSMILNYMPVPLTQSLGNFQKEGLNVKVENFQAGGSKALQALIAGSTDAVVGFYDHTIHIQAQGKDIVSVALLNITPGIVLAVMLSVLVSMQVAADGESNWLKGVQLLCVYAVIALATGLGVGLDFTPIDPVAALYWSAVINGVIAAPLMVVTMIMARTHRIMGRFVVPWPMTALGWLATLVMIAMVCLMVVTSL